MLSWGIHELNFSGEEVSNGKGIIWGVYLIVMDNLNAMFNYFAFIFRNISTKLHQSIFKVGLSKIITRMLSYKRSKFFFQDVRKFHIS